MYNITQYETSKVSNAILYNVTCNVKQIHITHTHFIYETNSYNFNSIAYLQGTRRKNFKLMDI